MRGMRLLAAAFEALRPPQTLLTASPDASLRCLPVLLPVRRRRVRAAQLAQ